MTQPPQYQPPPAMPGPDNQPPASWPPPQPSKSRGLLLWIVGALAVLVLGGAGLAAALLSGDKKPAAPVATAAPLPKDACGGGLCQTKPAAAGDAADANAVAACQAAWKAFSDDRLMTTDVLAVEQPARDTTNAKVKAAGAALLDAYRIAVIAKSDGDDDALAKEIELTTASAEMNTACLKAGVDVG